MSWDFYGPMYWMGDVPEYCNGTLTNQCKNNSKTLENLGVFYDSSIPGLRGAGFWFCEDCHNSFGAGQLRDDHSPRYELQKDGKWLLTKGGTYFRPTEDGKKVNYKDEEGNTRLHDAVKTGDIDYIKILLNTEGLIVNQSDDEGKTPLDLAELFGDQKIIGLLKTFK